MINWIRLLLICVGLNIGNLINAQDTLDLIELKEIIIVDVIKHDIIRLPRIQEANIYAGKKNEVILLSNSTADLSTNNSRQLFAKVPGVMIWENDGTGIQTSIATRGLSPNRSWEFNMRQNGFDISSEVFGYPEAYYTPPTESVERIEVVRGAAALQYGPQFGGMLNYVTKKSLGNKPFSIESQQTLGSFGLFNSYNAIGGKYKKLSYYAYFHHRNAQGWRENSRFQTNTGAINLTYDISKKWQLSMEYTRMNYVSQQAGGLTDSLFNADASQSLRERNWFNAPWNIASLKLNYAPSESTFLSVSIFGLLAERNSVGFTKAVTIEDTINTTLGSYNPRQVDRDSYANLGAEVRFLHQYKLLKNKSAISSGIRFYQGNTTRRQAGIGTTGMDFDLSIASQTAGYDYSKELNLSTKNASIFIENMFMLTKKLSVTPAVRFEFVQANIDARISTTAPNNIEDERVRTILLFGIGAEYATSFSTNVYANFSQGYRPVLFSELTPSATTDVIDPNLKDASGYNLDAGFRGSLFKHNLKFDIGLFRLLYNNRIGTITKDGFPYRTNIGTSVSQGIESFIELNVFGFSSITKKWGALNMFASYSFTDARYTRWDNPALINDPVKGIVDKKVEYAPNNVLRAGITYKLKGFSATFQYSFVDEVFTDAANSIEPNATFTAGKLDAYSLLDLNLAYALKENYTFKAGVNNLANTMYATRRSGGYPGPGILPGTGRSLYVTVGVKF
ncbi:MAG: TonB-dependent receptor [Bacteroidota bacterium]